MQVNREWRLIVTKSQALCCAAVWALLLEHTHPRIATDVHYVAGDRVVQDPLCKPFSMGRNLFCVHSKKHMDDDLSLKDEKTRTNRQTLTKLSRELNKVTMVLSDSSSAWSYTQFRRADIVMFFVLVTIFGSF